MPIHDCPITSSLRCLRSLISVVSESISISVSVTASPARDNFLEILRWMSDLAIRSVTFSSNDSLAPSGSSPLCFWRPTTSLFRFCSFRFSELTWLDLQHHGAFLLGSRNSYVPSVPTNYKEAYNTTNNDVTWFGFHRSSSCKSSSFTATSIMSETLLSHEKSSITATASWICRTAFNSVTLSWHRMSSVCNKHRVNLR